MVRKPATISITQPKIWGSLPYKKLFSKPENVAGMTLLLKTTTIIRAVKKEQEIIQSYIDNTKNVAGIISDNRFGCYSKQLPSVYMTHQLNVLSGFLTPILSLILSGSFPITYVLPKSASHCSNMGPKSIKRISSCCKIKFSGFSL